MSAPDFTRYAVASRYAVQINAGYSANLFGLARDPGVRPAPEAAAWLHGFDMAQRHVSERTA